MNGQRLPMEQADFVTKKILEALIDNKEKLDKINKWKTFWKWITLSGVAVYLFYLLNIGSILSQSNTSYLFQELFNNGIHFFFILFMLTNYGILMTLNKIADKRKDDYESLRAEVINRSEELWGNSNFWDLRHHLFEQLKKEYDINLYHEN